MGGDTGEQTMQTTAATLGSAGPQDEFKAGQWARVIGGKHVGDVGYIIDDSGLSDIRYKIGLRDAVDEMNFSASELELWYPKVGERVIEVGEGNEEEFGTVLFASSAGALILWDDFPDAQMFRISKIEPLLDELTDSVS
jgi:hypothetical protein